MRLGDFFIGFKFIGRNFHPINFGEKAEPILMKHLGFQIGTWSYYLDVDIELHPNISWTVIREYD